MRLVYSDSMQISRQHILIGIVTVVVLGLGTYLYFHRGIAAPATSATDTANTSSATSSTPSGEVGMTVNGNGNTIHLGAAMPSFTRPLSFASGVQENVKGALSAQFADVTAQLAKNSNQMDLWLLLGTLRKMGGDYQGAIEDWNYVAQNGNAISYVAYGNLADLYVNFVKDYPKAEASYKAAIALEPAYPDFYRGLFTLYTTTSYKSTPTAAEDILKQGIATNPNSADLKSLLNEYDKSLGR